MNDGFQTISGLFVVLSFLLGFLFSLFLFCFLLSYLFLGFLFRYFLLCLFLLCHSCTSMKKYLYLRTHSVSPCYCVQFDRLA